MPQPKLPVLILLAALTACAGPHISQTELDNLPTLQTQFRNGTAKLDCGLGCAEREGAAAQTLLALYNMQDWVDLSNEVLTIDSNSDESWYYLGRAAEGLGYYPAAEHYYTQALAANFKCESPINICDGLAIQALAQSHLIAVIHQLPAASPAPISAPTVAATSPQIRVPLVNMGDELTVPAILNNKLTLQFVVDSGATTVGLPDAVVLSLIHDGTLQKSDVLGTTTYMLADGSHGKSLVFHIRTLQVGSIILKNVVAGSTGPHGDLMLGQSFLSHFKSWSIENNSALVLN